VNPNPHLCRHNISIQHWQQL